MTLGEHIQMLRKNAGLSQEELGEKLGVARQSVSKWESDATIPELDKLIAMSKLFGVSLGVLLGLEESDVADHELTDRELAALEAIAQRLTPAKETDPGREKAYASRFIRRWLLVLVALVVITAGWAIFDLIRGLEGQISGLSTNMLFLENNVTQQIHNISSQVKGILEEQNSVIAGKNYEVVDMDLLNNTVTFSITATPREYREGMTAVFSATGPDFEPVEVPATLGTGQTFTAELTCPLTDDITLWVAFTGDGATANQQMGKKSYLLSDTQVDVYGHLSYSISTMGGELSVLTFTAQAWLSQNGWYTTRAEGRQEIQAVEGTLRLWRGEELLWSQIHTDLEWPPFEEVEIPVEGLNLVPGDRVILSLLYTDSAGRELEVFVDGFEIDADGNPGWMAPRSTEEWDYPWES